MVKPVDVQLSHKSAAVNTDSYQGSIWADQRSNCEWEPDGLLPRNPAPSHSSAGYLLRMADCHIGLRQYRSSEKRRRVLSAACLPTQFNPIITFLFSFFVFLPFSVWARVHSDCGLHYSLTLKGFQPAPLHLNGWEQAVLGGFHWVTQLAMERSDPTLLLIQPSVQPANQLHANTHYLLPCKTCGHFSTIHTIP